MDFISSIPHALAGREIVGVYENPVHEPVIGIQSSYGTKPGHFDAVRYFIVCLIGEAESYRYEQTWQRHALCLPSF